MSKAADIRDRLDVLEAERLVLTIELRNDLVRAARRLLPRAIAQAEGRGRGKNAVRSPALLRLIARLAMRDVRLEKTP